MKNVTYDYIEDLRRVFRVLELGMFADNPIETRMFNIKTAMILNNMISKLEDGTLRIIENEEWKE